eukprot:CAMPEP_0115851306 /NCGR_PEP_ID=MMETSP0287-20121206/12414_1 /TAXON_ID=412157 /ORGANISM="Chrysochromulina rotalis, Strain UIO044" /LENGTH=222 /DNA_ID=CAMNT_0003305335 /DNA_START=104 /DNA_END=769 /DNA_ORIENTATION=+
MSGPRPKFPHCAHQRFGPSTRAEAVRMLTITHAIARTSPSTLGDGAGSWRARKWEDEAKTPHRMRKRRQGTRDAAASFWSAGDAESASVTSHEAQAGWPRCRVRWLPAGAGVHTLESGGFDLRTWRSVLRHAGRHNGAGPGSWRCVLIHPSRREGRALDGCQQERVFTPWRAAVSIYVHGDQCCVTRADTMAPVRAAGGASSFTHHGERVGRSMAASRSGCS